MEYELYHWGVRGMKWGIRRYQNKDGTLTPAGKKRYNKEMEKLKEEAKVLKNKEATKAKLDKLESMRKSNEDRKKALDGDDDTTTKTAAKGKSSEESTPKQKSVKDMSNEELNAIVSRLDLEQRYRNHNPEQVSKGKAFVDGFIEKAVVPAIQDVAKNKIKEVLTSAVSNAAGSKKSK